MKNKYEVREEVTAIFLNKRDGSITEAAIDTQDLPLVSDFKGTWYQTKNGYVAIEVGKRNVDRTSLTMHRVLFGYPDFEIDHFNRNKLDNRRSSNLREATRGQNNQNRSSFSKNKSGYRGVYWNSRYQVWQVRIEINGKVKCFGTYRDVHEAGKTAMEKRAEIMPFSPEAAQ